MADGIRFFANRLLDHTFFLPFQNEVETKDATRGGRSFLRLSFPRSVRGKLRCFLRGPCREVDLFEEGTETNRRKAIRALIGLQDHLCGVRTDKKKVTETENKGTDCLKGTFNRLQGAVLRLSGRGALNQLPVKS